MPGREQAESWRLQAVDVLVPLIDRPFQSRLSIPRPRGRVRSCGERGFFIAGVAVLAALGSGLAWTYTGQAVFAASGFLLLSLAALRIALLARSLARPTLLRDVILTPSSLVLVAASASGSEAQRLYHREDGESLEGRVVEEGYELSLGREVFLLPSWSAERGAALLREIRRASRSRRSGGR